MNFENLCIGEQLSTTCCNFTVNGECSNCGSCCGNILPLSDKEVKRIKTYVKKHRIKAYNNIPNIMNQQLVDMTCPFRDNDKKICTIYDARPWVCRAYKCDYTIRDIAEIARTTKMENYMPQDMRAIFFNQNQLGGILKELAVNAGIQCLKNSLKSEFQI